MIQLVLTTFPSVSQAGTIARQLVRARLAACATLVPGVTSIYTWNESLEEQQECLLMLKTTRDCVKKLQIEIRKLHPYEVPEILLFEVNSCLSAYTEWVKYSCTQ